MPLEAFREITERLRKPLVTLLQKQIWKCDYLKQKVYSKLNISKDCCEKEAVAIVQQRIDISVQGTVGIGIGALSIWKFFLSRENDRMKYEDVKRNRIEQERYNRDTEDSVTNLVKDSVETRAMVVDLKTKVEEAVKSMGDRMDGLENRKDI